MDTVNFWDASDAALRSGYEISESGCRCIICGKTYAQGEVFREGEHWFDARTATAHHVEAAHGSMLDWLLSLPPEQLGVTDVQHTILQMMRNGKSDAEIAREKAISQSTCRNHRYKLREKERQARLYLAAMELMRGIGCSEAFHDAPPASTVNDDRFAITEKERDRVLNYYFDENGALKDFPVKEKKKIVVLEKLAENFAPGHVYNEKEVSRILSRIYADHAYLRRLLIEYGFMERNASGSEYRRKTV